MPTNAQYRNAVCPPDKLRAQFTDSGGVYSGVCPAGPQRWFIRYRVTGKEKQLTLGSYSSVSLTLQRKALDAAKIQNCEGRDPGQARKVEKLKATQTEGDTFKATSLEWHKGRPHNGVKATPDA